MFMVVNQFNKKNFCVTCNVENIIIIQDGISDADNCDGNEGHTTVVVEFKEIGCEIDTEGGFDKKKRLIFRLFFFSSMITIIYIYLPAKS